MSLEYDKITAYHYAAYRPLLHTQILEEVLSSKNKADLGLDIGCGTGQSSIALTNFCKKVIGIEPSQEMLDNAIVHQNVEYSYYDCEHIEYQDNLFDIITFAGSLFYGKSQQLLDETIRVSKNNAQLIAYDFNTLLEPVIESIGVKPNVEPINYNHSEDFSGLNTNNIGLINKFEKPLQLVISATNLAHLLLSSKDNYRLLKAHFGSDNLYQKVLEALLDKTTTIETMTYLTSYKVAK